MTQHQSIPLAGGIRTWLNDGSAMPPWVCDRITDDKSPNGSFLIPTPLGTTRVHAGHVVIEHGGKIGTKTKTGSGGKRGSERKIAFGRRVAPCQVLSGCMLPH